MSQKIINNRLEKKTYFIEELNCNKNLKKWHSLKNYFVILEYENKYIFIRKDSKFHILNANKDSLDTDIIDFLSTLISSYPEKLSEYFVKDFIIYSVNGSKKTYDTKKKGYFINRLDKFLQDILGVENTSIDKFKENNRKFIHFTRGKTPSFKDNIIIDKIEDEDFIGLIYYASKIHKLNKIKSIEVLELALSIFRRNNNTDFYVYDLFKTYINLQTFNKESSSLDNKKISLIIDFFSILVKAINMIKNSHSSIKEKFLYFITKDILKEIESITNIIINKNKNIYNPNISKYFELLKININKFLETDCLINLEDLNLEVENLISELAIGNEEVNLSNNKDKINKTIFSKFNINYDGSYCEQPDWNKLIISSNEIFQLEKKSKEVWIAVSNLNDLENIMGKKHINAINNSLSSDRNYTIFYKSGTNTIFNKNRNLTLHKLDILEKIFIPFEYTILIYNPNDIDDLYGFYLGLFEELNKQNYDKFYFSIYYKNLIKLTNFLIENIN